LAEGKSGLCNRGIKKPPFSVFRKAAPSKKRTIERGQRLAQKSTGRRQAELTEKRSTSRPRHITASNPLAAMFSPTGEEGRLGKGKIQKMKGVGNSTRGRVEVSKNSLPAASQSNGRNISQEV